MSKTIKLSEKFMNVIPPRTIRQIEQKTKQRLENGRSFPFLTRNGVLVDDYEDYKICKENNIPFKTKELYGKSEDETISQIVYTQLSIGQLSSFQRCEILLRNQDALEATADMSGYNFPADFAKLAGVSQRNFDLAREILTIDDKNLLNQLRDERISISHAYKLLESKIMERAEMEELKDDLRCLIDTIESFYGVPSIVFPTLQKIAKKYRKYGN